MKIMRCKNLLLAVCLCASGCSLPLASQSHTAPLKKWESEFINISLAPKDPWDDGRVLRYVVKFKDDPRVAFFSSQNVPDEIDASFSNPQPSSFTSAIIFSSDGKYAVIRDVYPGTASGEYDFYLINGNSPIRVFRFDAPTRPGPVIPETPLAVSVDSEKVGFLFDEDPKSVTIEISKLQATATPIKLSEHANP